MSSVLKHKKKKMEPRGYTKQEVYARHLNVKLEAEQEAIISNVLYTLRNMTFYLLYYKFDFTKRKLENFAKGMAEYDNGCKMSTESVFDNIKMLKDRTHVDLQEYARKIPTNEKMKLAGAVAIKTKEEMHRMTFGVRTGYLTYLTAVLMVLRKKYRFTIKQINEFVFFINDHINSFYRDYFNDSDLIVVLAEEIGYQF